MGAYNFGLRIQIFGLRVKSSGLKGLWLWVNGKGFTFKDS
jgi:hypothetical protein